MNNESMNTVVETFIVQETQELIHDNEKLESWHGLVNELGLKGQTTVVTKEKSPIPYLWMNSALIATFETLCPSKVDIESYDKSPIPTEILSLVSMSKKEKHFDLIQIWFNEEEKDPVCIGYKYDPEKVAKNESEWYLKHSAKRYLIGRWADVKSSLDQLVQKARNFYVQAKKIELTRSIKLSQRELEDLEDNATGFFSGAIPTTSLPF